MGSQKHRQTGHRDEAEGREKQTQIETLRTPPAQADRGRDSQTDTETDTETEKDPQRRGGLWESRGGQGQAGGRRTAWGTDPPKHRGPQPHPGEPSGRARYDPPVLWADGAFVPAWGSVPREDVRPGWRGPVSGIHIPLQGTAIHGARPSQEAEQPREEEPDAVLGGGDSRPWEEGGSGRRGDQRGSSGRTAWRTGLRFSALSPSPRPRASGFHRAWDSVYAGGTSRG